MARESPKDEVSAAMESEVAVGLSLNENSPGKSPRNVCVTVRLELAGIGLVNTISSSSVELLNMDFVVAAAMMRVSFLETMLSV